MTTNQKQRLIEILEAIAERIGAGKLSEPKHGIKGDPIADAIYQLALSLES